MKILEETGGTSADSALDLSRAFSLSDFLASACGSPEHCLRLRL